MDLALACMPPYAHRCAGAYCCRRLQARAAAPAAAYKEKQGAGGFGFDRTSTIRIEGVKTII